LNENHIVNQILYLDDKQKWRKLLDKKIEELNKSSNFGSQNKVDTPCLLARDKSNLKEDFTVTAEYLDDTLSGSKKINYYEHDVQLSRSFRALKLYTFF